MCLCVWREGDKKDDSYIYFFYLSSKIKLTWLVAGVHPYVVNPEAPYSAIRGTAAGSLSLSADQDIIWNWEGKRWFQYMDAGALQTAALDEGRGAR